MIFNLLPPCHLDIQQRMVRRRQEINSSGGSTDPPTPCVPNLQVHPSPQSDGGSPFPQSQSKVLAHLGDTMVEYMWKLFREDRTRCLLPSSCRKCLLA